MSSTWIFLAAFATVVLQAVHMVLDFVKSRTKTTLDDRADDIVQRAIAEMKKLLPPVALLVVLLFGASGCAPNTRTATLRVSLMTIDTASAALVAYNDVHERAIAEQGTSRADIDAKTAAWHATRDKLDRDLTAGIRAVAVAAGLSDDHSAESALEAAHAIIDELRELGITPP